MGMHMNKIYEKWDTKIISYFFKNSFDGDRRLVVAENISTFNDK